jgi:hypothetical protein
MILYQPFALWFFYPVLGLFFFSASPHAATAQVGRDAQQWEASCTNVVIYIVPLRPARAPIRAQGFQPNTGGRGAKGQAGR